MSPISDPNRTATSVSEPLQCNLSPDVRGWVVYYLNSALLFSVSSWSRLILP
jgi:hypothetical protein